MYALLTIKMHYPPKYVLDEMEWYEISAALDYQHFTDKESWEQNRFIAYIIAQVNSKKRLKLEDIMKFPWDDEDKPKEIPIEEIKRLQEKANSYISKKK